MLILHVSLPLCVIAVLGSVKAAFNCPAQNKSAELRFTVELGSKDYVRINHGVDIPCCAEGYENITWYKEVNGTWQPAPSESEVLHDGQVLQFLDIQDTDAATYRCQVVGQSKVIYHDTQIVVEECDKLPRGPYMVDPFPENQTIYDYGGSITFHCTGYFGCTEIGDAHLVLWEVEGSSKPITNISSRYSITNIKDDRSDKLKIGSTLTINSVRKEDVERTFICILASTQKIDGQMSEKVRIFKKDKPLSPLELGFIIGVPVFAVVILVLIYLLRTLYGPQIQLFCCSRFEFCGPKAIDNDEYSYNLFIYHAEDDETMAQNIKQFLSNKGYKVFIAADIEGNENIMHKVFEKTEHSALVVFLYSKDLREDDLANFFLQSMIRSRKGKRILILEVEAYKPKQIRQWHKKHAENIRVLHEQYINEQDRNIEIGTDVSEEMGDDLQFWKILPSIKVPNLDQKGRKLRNFRCALQNKIPKFDHQKQRKGMEQQIAQRHSSSERPLLYSTSESETLTPQCITNNAGEFSPSSNEVFTFEQETNLSGHDKIIDDNRKALASSTNDIRSDNCDVRGELSGDRGNDLIHAVVCNNHENLVGSPHTNHDSNNVENNESRKEEKDKTTVLKNKQDIFTMSGEEPTSRSFDSESGYSGEHYSDRGIRYKSSLSDESSLNVMPSSQSSGFSDLNSVGSFSPSQMPYNANEPYSGQTNPAEDRRHIVPGTTDGYLSAETSNIVADKCYNGANQFCYTTMT